MHLISFERLLRIVALLSACTVVMFLSVAPQSANDFWMQTKIGSLIVANHAIPDTLFFPFSMPDAPFVASQWLASVGFFAMVSLVGESGVPLIMGLFGLVLFALLGYLVFKRSGGSLPWSLLLGFLAICVENFRHVPRPEVLSLLLFVIYLILLDNFKRAPTWVAGICAVAVVVLWTNIHGSFVLAPIICAIYAIGVLADEVKSKSNISRVRMLIVLPFVYLTVAVIASTLINPAGFQIWKFVFGFTGSGNLGNVVYEWHPTLDLIFSHTRGWWIGLACMVVMLMTTAINWKKMSFVDLLLVCVFLFFALKAIRFLVYIGIITAYVSAPLIPEEWKRTMWNNRLFAGFLCISLGVFGLAANYGNANGSFPNRFYGDRSFTEPMLKALGDPMVNGNVLCAFELGSELVYRAYPSLKPSIDSRIDGYGVDYYLYHENLFQNNNLMLDYVNKFHVKYALMDFYRFGFFKNLESFRNGDWRPISADHRHIFLEYVGKYG